MDTSNLKDSGIRWIGKIPSDWKIVPLYFVSSEITAKNTNLVRKNAFKYNFGNIVDKSNFNPDEDKYVNKTIRNYILVNPGDIVINGLNLNFDFVTKRVGLVNKKGTITSAYISLRPDSKKIIPKYLLYLLKTYDFEKAFHNMGGGVRKILNYDELGKNKILLPRLQIQEKIVDFLNKKSSQIDKLSQNIQQEIADLEEYRKSIITQAVTKGLDKNVPMKNSGIEWIGKIPKDWAIGKIKYYLTRNEPRGHGNDEVLSVYRDYGVIPKNSRTDNHNVTSKDTSKYKYVEKGELVINKMKAWQGSLSVSKYEGIVSPAYYVYKFINDKLNRDYFNFLIRNCYKEEFRRISGGIRIGQWDLPANEFENILILIPPKKEQKDIVNFLNRKNNLIKSIINDKKEQLRTLNKYKQSIIYEYVTGKRQVPDKGAK